MLLDFPFFEGVEVGGVACESARQKFACPWSVEDHNVGCSAIKVVMEVRTLKAAKTLLWVGTRTGLIRMRVEELFLPTVTVRTMLFVRTAFLVLANKDF